MAGEMPGSPNGPRSDRGQVAWSFLLNAILVAAFVLIRSTAPGAE